jgi:hypothetical protein
MLKPFVSTAYCLAYFTLVAVYDDDTLLQWWAQSN